MRTAAEQIRSLETRIARLEKASSIPFNQLENKMDGAFYREYKKLNKIYMAGKITEEEFDEALSKLEKKFDLALTDSFSNKEYEAEENIGLEIDGKSFEKVNFINQRFKDNYFINCDFLQCQFIGVHYSKGSLKNSIFANCVFRNTSFWMTDFTGVRLVSGRFDNCDFSKAKNLRKIENQEALTEKQVKNLLEQKLNRGDRLYFERLLTKPKREEDDEKIKREEKLKREEDNEKRKIKLMVEKDKKRKEEKRKRREESRKRREEKRKIEEEKRKIEEERTLIETKRRIDKAKTDKELEALAVEVGSLQAQPEYEDYGQQLKNLQETIESKYSLVGKGLRFLKRLFSRGKRASQIRIANQMREDLHKEIRDLKSSLK